MPCFPVSRWSASRIGCARLNRANPKAIRGFMPAQTWEGFGVVSRQDHSGLRHVQPLKSPSTERQPTGNLRTTWPDGRRMVIGSHGRVNYMLNQGIRGNIPFYERGVTTRLLPNDGSSRWSDLYNRAKDEPVFLAQKNSGRS